MNQAPYTLAEEAQQDIENIIEYIFEDNPRAALAIETQIYETFDFLAKNPRIGHLRTDLTEKPYRFWTFRKPYLIIYAEDKPLRIMRVMSGFQDIATSLMNTKRH